MGVVKCSKCGKTIKNDDIFCKYCGYNRENNLPENNPIVEKQVKKDKIFVVIDQSIKVLFSIIVILIFIGLVKVSIDNVIYKSSSEESFENNIKDYIKEKDILLNVTKVSVLENKNKKYDVYILAEPSSNEVSLWFDGINCEELVENIIQYSSLKTSINDICFEIYEKGNIKYYIEYQSLYNLTIDTLNNNLIIKNSNKKVLNTTLDLEYENYVKKEAKTYDYKTLYRYSEDYLFDLVKYKGKVVQVINDSKGNAVAYRVNVTKDKLGYYDDIIYLATNMLKAPTIRILEDDIITFYGRVGLLYTYESIMGVSVTVPLVYGYYIELN